MLQCLLRDIRMNVVVVGIGDLPNSPIFIITAIVTSAENRRKSADRLQPKFK